MSFLKTPESAMELLAQEACYFSILSLFFLLPILYSHIKTVLSATSFFLQIITYIYLKLTYLPSAQPTSTSQTTPPHIDGQTAARHGLTVPSQPVNPSGHLVKS
jgi:hypothetical protein